MTKKLYKSRSDVRIDGVCAGVANYFGLDPTVVRLVWVLLAFTSAGLIAYIICSVIMPREPESGFSDGYDSEPHHN
ncbi:MAG: PspC domain-containing protein [Clostridiales bacterium]|jgi:phage shock protein C|nr:PspC domain-containing protein [Clostridiales bacterium]